MIEEALFEYLVGTVLVEDICVCMKERMLEESECQHCGKVHGKVGEELNLVGEEEVECDCGKKMSASRFASHLEKCSSSNHQTSIITNNNSNNINTNSNNKKRKQK